MHKTTVVCLGDSVTKGVREGVKKEETFCFLLEESLNKSGLSTIVVNSGVGGHTTADALKRFQSDVLAHRPQLVVIMFGLNDSWIDEGKTTSRLTVDEYTENLKEMLSYLRIKDIRAILMTPNPVVAPTYPPERNRTLSPYVKAVRELARQKKIPLVDVYARFGELALEGVNLNSLYTDAMHPNPKGHQVLAEMLFPIVRSLAIA
jgi:acyl-CoA thioesterase-1